MPAITVILPDSWIEVMESKRAELGMKSRHALILESIQRFTGAPPTAAQLSRQARDRVKAERATHMQAQTQEQIEKEIADMLGATVGVVVSVQRTRFEMAALANEFLDGKSQFSIVELAGVCGASPVDLEKALLGDGWVHVGGDIWARDADFMTKSTKEAMIKALKDDVGNAMDNLRRAEASFSRCDPEVMAQRYGQSESMRTEILDNYLRRYEKAKAALAEAEAEL